MKLTKKECQELRDKIESEGFEYYFCDYGPDLKLEQLMGDQIRAYVSSKRALVDTLIKNGIDIEP